MSVRKKAICAFWFVYGSFLLTAITGTLIDFRFFLYGEPILVLGAAVYMRGLRCPNCGESIYKRRKDFLGLEVVYYLGLVPRRCAWCGQDLNRAGKASSLAFTVE